MDLRKRIREAIKRETAAISELELARDEKRAVVDTFFALRYGVAIGETVLSDEGKEVKLAYYRPWSDNLDDRPDIFGGRKLPFGWSHNIERFSFREWRTHKEAEERSDDVGNK